MMHQKNIKIQLVTALALCVLALTMGLSLAVIAVHADHDCQGARCPACLHIGQAAAALRGLAAVGAFMLLSATGGLCRCVSAITGSSAAQSAGRTLVALRTRMDN